MALLRHHTRCGHCRCGLTCRAEAEHSLRQVAPGWLHAHCSRTLARLGIAHRILPAPIRRGAAHSARASAKHSDLVANVVHDSPQRLERRVRACTTAPLCETESESQPRRPFAVSVRAASLSRAQRPARQAPVGQRAEASREQHTAATRLGRGELGRCCMTHLAQASTECRCPGPHEAAHTGPYPGESGGRA
jgi:hypothetical protein